MTRYVNDSDLLQFVQDVFSSFGISRENALICADNLVLADLRGVSSHGVARLRRYVDGMTNGTILPHSEPWVVREAPSTATVDGRAGLGQITGHFSTGMAIEKAKKTGVGIVAVRNSNHYGIAGYYTQMMLEAGLLGISMTNTAPLVVPTFGRKMIIGTNPISLTAPTKRNRPFFLDMATSVVPRGKLEVYDRMDRDMPAGWAVDSRGLTTTDATEVLKNMVARLGGGILPLGGEGELYGGHKGYGIALLVDILCGVLSGGAYADMVDVKGPGGKGQPARVAHFFMALNIENFVELDVFQEKMDDLIDRLKESEKAEGQERIYIHGEKEYELYEKHKSSGVPLEEPVFDSLKAIALERGVPFEL
ncbi:Ldh family oxidoreductase [Syntrophus buswellii]|uniref:Ldh family oxidoreductase n=1 Tax=Syntrophus buswellii TaxID=43774 RepID=UPI0038D4153B